MPTKFCIASFLGLAKFFITMWHVSFKVFLSVVLPTIIMGQPKPIEDELYDGYDTGLCEPLAISFCRKMSKWHIVYFLLILVGDLISVYTTKHQHWSGKPSLLGQNKEIFKFIIVL